MSTLTSCLACGGDRLDELADLGSTPVLNGVMFEDRDKARAAALGQLKLAVCLDCGHVANVAFDPSLVNYDAAYDNSLHFSPTFRAYADALAQRLVDTYDLQGGRIVEIGSGKGDFLESITRLSGGVGVGYDPTVEPDRQIPNVTLVRDIYRPGHEIEPYRLLVCRHVLEHLEQPAETLRSLRQAAPPDAVYYFEVPAAEHEFGPEGMWDFIYPHVSYFSHGSLYSLLRRCGFEVVDAGRSFSDQFLWFDARAGSGGSETLDPTDHLASLADFTVRHEAAVVRWRTDFSNRARYGESTAFWGAGARGVNFLNRVDPDATLSVVDVNPRKWGGYIPGTGHQVTAPQSLATQRITKVVITNSVYLGEITQQLNDFGVRAEVAAI